MPCQHVIVVFVFSFFNALSLCIMYCGGGGSGIHRQNPSRMDFDYGTEYRAKVRVEITFWGWEL